MAEPRQQKSSGEKAYGNVDLKQTVEPGSDVRIKVIERMVIWFWVIPDHLKSLNITGIPCVLEEQ